VNGVPAIVAIDASFLTSLAIDRDGHVWAWGDNLYGQVGLGRTGPSEYTPVKVPIDNVKMVSAGNGFTAALKNDGTVRARGFNSGGLIGNDVRDQKVYQPGKVGSMSGIANFAVGSVHVLGLKADGSPWARGDNQFGEMGQGKIDDKTYLPTRVALGDAIVDTSKPTAVAGDASNGTDDTPVTPGGSSSYLMMGIFALACMVIAAGALVWYSRK
jgi:alpha-tubulin suppressor-like RCC1 family protein